MILLTRLQSVGFAALAVFEWVQFLLSVNVNIDAAPVITAIFAGVLSILTFIASYTAVMATRAYREVRTSNALRMGEKSDLDEMRRIEALPEADRTSAERSHVRTMEEQAHLANPDDPKK